MGSRCGLGAHRAPRHRVALTGGARRARGPVAPRSAPSADSFPRLPGPSRQAVRLRLADASDTTPAISATAASTLACAAAACPAVAVACAVSTRGLSRSNRAARSAVDGFLAGNSTSDGARGESKVFSDEVNVWSTFCPLMDPTKWNVYVPGWVGMSDAW